MGQCVSSSPNNSRTQVDHPNPSSSKATTNTSSLGGGGASGGEVEAIQTVKYSTTTISPSYAQITVISEAVEPPPKVILKKIPHDYSRGRKSTFGMNFGRKGSPSPGIKKDRISSISPSTTTTPKRVSFFPESDSPASTNKKSKKSFAERLSGLPRFNRNKAKTNSESENSLIISNFPSSSISNAWATPDESSPSLIPSKEHTNHQERVLFDNNGINSSPLKELRVIRAKTSALRDQFFSTGTNNDENSVQVQTHQPQTNMNSNNSTRPSGLQKIPYQFAFQRKTFGTISSTSSIPQSQSQPRPILPQINASSNLNSKPPLNNITNKGEPNPSNGIAPSKLPRGPSTNSRSNMNEFIPATEFFNSNVPSSQNQNAPPKLQRRETAPAHPRPLKYGYGFSANGKPPIPSGGGHGLANPSASLSSANPSTAREKGKAPSPASQIGTRSYAVYGRALNLNSEPPSTWQSSSGLRKPVQSAPFYTLSLTRPKSKLPPTQIKLQSAYREEEEDVIILPPTENWTLVKQRAALFQSKIEEEKERTERSFEKCQSQKKVFNKSLNTSGGGGGGTPNWRFEELVNNKRKEMPGASAEVRTEDQVDNYIGGVGQQEKGAGNNGAEGSSVSSSSSKPEAFLPLSRDTSGASTNTNTSMRNDLTHHHHHPPSSIASATASTTPEQQNSISDSEFLDDEISDQPQLTLHNNHYGGGSSRDATVILSPSSSGESINSPDLMLEFSPTENSFNKAPHPKKLSQLNFPSNKGNSNSSPGNNVSTPKTSLGSGILINEESFNSSGLMLDYDSNENSQILPSPDKASVISNKSLSESSIEDKDEESDFDVSEFLEEVLDLKKQIFVLQEVLEEGARKEMAQNALITSLQKENDMLKNTLRLNLCSKCEMDLSSSFQKMSIRKESLSPKKIKSALE